LRIRMIGIRFFTIVLARFVVFSILIGIVSAQKAKVNCIVNFHSLRYTWEG
jgi:hypothetical protein